VQSAKFNVDGFVKSQEISFQFIPVPHQVLDRLQPESSINMEEKIYGPLFSPRIKTFRGRLDDDFLQIHQL